MNKEEIQDKLEQIEEAYKNTDSQIKQLKESKLRLEGQYAAFKSLLDEDEKEQEEIGD